MPQISPISQQYLFNAKAQRPQRRSCAVSPHCNAHPYGTYVVADSRNAGNLVHHRYIEIEQLCYHSAYIRVGRRSYNENSAVCLGWLGWPRAEAVC